MKNKYKMVSAVTKCVDCEGVDYDVEVQSVIRGKLNDRLEAILRWVEVRPQYSELADNVSHALCCLSMLECREDSNLADLAIWVGEIEIFIREVERQEAVDEEMADNCRRMGDMTVVSVGQPRELHRRDTIDKASLLPQAHDFQWLVHNLHDQGKTTLPPFVKAGAVDVDIGVSRGRFSRCRSG